MFTTNWNRKTTKNDLKELKQINFKIITKTNVTIFTPNIFDLEIFKIFFFMDKSFMLEIVHLKKKAKINFERFEFFSKLLDVQT